MAIKAVCTTILQLQIPQADSFYLQALTMFFLILLCVFSQGISTASHVGVNYGTVANNLPPPDRVARFLTSNTIISKVKIFDSNPQIIASFANTNTSLIISVPNDAIPSLAKLPAATSWVAANILPFYPKTRISYIAVGNEVLATSDKNLIAHTLPAMRALYAALLRARIRDIKVSTPHSLGILSSSEPPSSGRFRRGYDKVFFSPILEFHNRTASCFMVNPYPYFGVSQATLDYAVFKQNSGVVDSLTKLRYTNMFDAQLDAVHSAMVKVGYGNVDIMVAETGWPSAGSSTEQFANLPNAVSYNSNLVKHVSSGKGTPLMPNRTFETYIFALFNENQKPSVSEQNYGLFKPDLSPVYDAGVLLHPQGKYFGEPPSAQPSPVPSRCVPVANASRQALQQNIDYACSNGVNCHPIQPGGKYFEPNTVVDHAKYAMDAYYQIHGRHEWNCDFGKTGQIVG